MSMVDLPRLRSSRYCVLMPRHPHALYAYWHLDPHDIQKAQGPRDLKDGQLALRVHELSGETWDLDITASSRNYYIEVPHGNAHYCVEVGLKSDQNAFIALQQSNVVRTPSEGASARRDLIWQDIKVSKVAMPYIKELIGPSASLKGTVPVTLFNKGLYPSAKSARQKKVYYLTAQDIRNYYRHLFASVSRRGQRKRIQKALSLEDILKKKILGKISLAQTRPIPRRTCQQGPWGSLMGLPIGASENVITPHG